MNTQNCTYIYRRRRPVKVELRCLAGNRCVAWALAYWYSTPSFALTSSPDMPRAASAVATPRKPLPRFSGSPWPLGPGHQAGSRRQGRWNAAPTLRKCTIVRAAPPQHTPAPAGLGSRCPWPCKTNSRSPHPPAHTQGCQPADQASRCSRGRSQHFQIWLDYCRALPAEL